MRSHSMGSGGHRRQSSPMRSTAALRGSQAGTVIRATIRPTMRASMRATMRFTYDDAPPNQRWFGPRPMVICEQTTGGIRRNHRWFRLRPSVVWRRTGIERCEQPQRRRQGATGASLHLNRKATPYSFARVVSVRVARIGLLNDLATSFRAASASSPSTVSRFRTSCK